MSSAASPIEYMRVWTWTVLSLPVKPDAHLKRLNCRAHLSQSSGRVKLNCSGGETCHTMIQGQ